MSSTNYKSGASKQYGKWNRIQKKTHSIFLSFTIHCICKKDSYYHLIYATVLSTIGERKLCEARGIYIHILFALNCFMKYDFVSQARTKDWGKSFILWGRWKINWPYSIYIIFLHIYYIQSTIWMCTSMRISLRRSTSVMQRHAAASAMHHSQWIVLIFLKMAFEQYSVDSELALNWSYDKKLHTGEKRWTKPCHQM